MKLLSLFPSKHALHKLNLKYKISHTIKNFQLRIKKSLFDKKHRSYIVKVRLFGKVYFIIYSERTIKTVIELSDIDLKNPIMREALNLPLSEAIVK